MLILNPQNVEELIFYNKSLQQMLPEFRNTFSTWHLGKLMPSLRNLIQKSIFEFLDNIKDEHIKKLEEYFHTTIKIVNFDPHLVKSYSFDLQDCDLNEIELYENWFIWRDASKLYIDSWR